MSSWATPPSFPGGTMTGGVGDVFDFSGGNFTNFGSFINGGTLINSDSITNHGTFTQTGDVTLAAATTLGGGGSMTLSGAVSGNTPDQERQRHADAQRHHR